jgi:hypothetical protein
VGGAGRVPEGIPGFDVAKVAAMTERDVDRLVQDASIIRNRGKIQAVIDNARAMMAASPSLVVLAKSYEISRKRHHGPLPTCPSRPAGGGVREAAEVAGVPLRGAYECVRAHAERRTWSTTTSMGASARPTTPPRPGCSSREHSPLLVAARPPVNGYASLTGGPLRRSDSSRCGS